MCMQPSWQKWRYYKETACHMIWLSDCWNKRPQRNGRFPRTLTLRGGKSSRERRKISQGSNSLSTTSWDGAQTVMDQGGQDHPLIGDSSCMPLGLYLIPDLTSGPPKDLGVHWMPLSPFLMWPCWMNLLFLCSTFDVTLLFGLLRMVAGPDLRRWLWPLHFIQMNNRWACLQAYTHARAYVHAHTHRHTSVRTGRITIQWNIQKLRII